MHEDVTVNTLATRRPRSRTTRQTLGRTRSGTLPERAAGNEPQRAKIIGNPPVALRDMAVLSQQEP
eukprot:2213248-Lingulodinium_polyedra.AAC.1